MKRLMSKDKSGPSKISVPTARNFSTITQQLFFFTHARIIFSIRFIYNLLKLEPRLNPSPCDSVTARLQLYPAAVDSKLKTTLCFPTAASLRGRGPALTRKGPWVQKSQVNSLATSPALAEKHLPHCWQRSTVAKNKKPGTTNPG